MALIDKVSLAKLQKYSQQDVEYTLAKPEPNNIVCMAGGEEMLKVGPDGFWVRGIKVPQDDKEAEAVYNAFKQWLTWLQLTRT